MVVKTTRHDTRLNRTFFNYTDWHLIRACPRPLLLVKSADAWETRRIAACVDPAHVHSHAETLDEVIVETAHLLAYRLRGELHIFHSVELMLEPVFSLLQPESSYQLYKRRMGEAHYGLLDDLLRRYGIGAQRVPSDRGPADGETARVYARHRREPGGDGCGIEGRPGVAVDRQHRREGPR